MVIKTTEHKLGGRVNASASSSSSTAESRPTALVVSFALALLAAAPFLQPSTIQPSSNPMANLTHFVPPAAVQLSDLEEFAMLPSQEALELLQQTYSLEALAELRFELVPQIIEDSHETDDLLTWQVRLIESAINREPHPSGVIVLYALYFQVLKGNFGYEWEEFSAQFVPNLDALVASFEAVSCV